MDFRGRPGASRARLRPRCRRIVLANPSVCRRPPLPRPPPPMPGTPEARGLETNGDLLQFSRGASSTPPFGSLLPQVTASLRLGYFGRHAKTAANRRLFAERRLCCSESAFAASGRRGPLLAESGGGAEARTSCPTSAGSAASAAVGPAPASAGIALPWRIRRADAGPAAASL